MNYIRSCDVCRQPIYIGEDCINERKRDWGEWQGRHATLEACIIALGLAVESMQQQ